MSKATKNAHIVDEPAEGQETMDLHIDNPEALGGGAEPVSDATTSVAGKVKMATTVADVSATDAAAAASETVTKAEFDAVVTLANGLKATVNALLAASRAAGQLQS